MLKHNGHLTPSASEGTEYADGHLSETPSEDDGVFIQQIAARFDLTTEQAIEIYAEIEEHIGACRKILSASAASSVGPSDASLRLMIQRGLRVCAAARNANLQIFMVKCMMLALGMADDLGVDNAADLARKCGVCKADATNYVVMFRDILPEGLDRLPPGRGQRSPETRRGFAELRRKQQDDLKVKMKTQMGVAGMTVKPV